MTLKFKRSWRSKKGQRRLRNIPACKRLEDYIEAAALKRYKLKRNWRASK